MQNPIGLNKTQLDTYNSVITWNKPCCNDITIPSVLNMVIHVTNHLIGLNKTQLDTYNSVITWNKPCLIASDFNRSNQINELSWFSRF